MPKTSSRKYKCRPYRSSESWRGRESPIPKGQTVTGWVEALRKSAGVREEVYEVQTPGGLEEHTLFCIQTGQGGRASAPTGPTLATSDIVYYLHPTDVIQPRLQDPYRNAQYGSTLGEYLADTLYDVVGKRGGFSTKDGRLLTRRNVYNALSETITSAPPAIQASLVQQGLAQQEEGDVPGWWFVLDGLFSRHTTDVARNGIFSGGTLLETLVFEPSVPRGKAVIPSVIHHTAPRRTLQRWVSERSEQHPRGRSFLLQTSHLPGTDTRGPPTKIRLHCSGGELRLLHCGTRYTATASPAAFSTTPNSLTRTDGCTHWTPGHDNGVLSATSRYSGHIADEANAAGAPSGAREALAELAARYVDFYGTMTKLQPHSLTWDVGPQSTRAERLESTGPGEVAYTNVPLTWEWHYRPPEQGEVLRRRRLIESLETNAPKDDARKYTGKTGDMSLVMMRSLEARPDDPHTVIRLCWTGTMTHTRTGDAGNQYSFDPYYAPYDDKQVLHRDSLFPVGGVEDYGVIVPRETSASELFLDQLARDKFGSAAELLQVQDDYCYDKLGEGSWRFLGGDYAAKASTVTHDSVDSVSRNGVTLVGWWRYQCADEANQAYGSLETGSRDLPPEPASKRRRTALRP